MIDLERPVNNRRRRQIEMLDAACVVHGVRTSAETLDACCRRSRQIMFDARLALDTAGQRIELSRHLLDPRTRR